MHNPVSFFTDLVQDLFWQGSKDRGPQPQWQLHPRSSCHSAQEGKLDLEPGSLPCKLESTTSRLSESSPESPSPWRCTARTPSCSWSRGGRRRRRRASRTWPSSCGRLIHNDLKPGIDLWQNILVKKSWEDLGIISALKGFGPLRLLLLPTSPLAPLLFSSSPTHTHIFTHPEMPPFQILKVSPAASVVWSACAKLGWIIQKMLILFLMLCWLNTYHWVGYGMGYWYDFGPCPRGFCKDCRE